MLNLLRAMDLSKYSPRVYIAAATDTMSLKRAQTLEEDEIQVHNDTRMAGNFNQSHFSISVFTSTLSVLPRGQASATAAPEDPSQRAAYLSVYRSREVGQSYLSSIWTTILALLHSVALVAQVQPDIVSTFHMTCYMARLLCSTC